MAVLNRTVFDIPLTWNRTRFESTRNKCRIARKLIDFSINVQFEKQIRGIFSHNIEIDENINDINERLLKYHDKLRVLDNMIELASQSLRIYFDRRMENVRAIVNEHCNIIQQIIHEEADHWKEIHSIMDQNLINPGDIRSRDNFPRVIQKSPASNIETIEEEDDNDDDKGELVTKLLNGKTLTPLLTQMIRKSRVQSKRLTIVPSIKITAPNQQEYSIPRKEERFTTHLIPLSIVRQPLQIIDTTFVVKPEETMIDGEIQNNDEEDDDNDEPNGTYRAPNQYCHSHLCVNQPETFLIDSQRNIPARLCFSPTILQDVTDLPEDDTHEQSSSSPPSSKNEKNEESMHKILLPVNQNRTNIKQIQQDKHRFGQTFLLHNVKTEQVDNDQNEYIRPTIPDDGDDDVLVIADTKQSEHIPHTTNNNPSLKSNSSNQQEISTVQETVPVKNRTRITTKPKTKSVIVSARKTRSATKVIAEQEAEVAVATEKVLVEKPIETKRKTRKRKQSKSIDRPAETSDDENKNQQSNSTRMINNKRKTKRRRKSKTDTHPQETSDDDPIKRKTRKRSKPKQIDDQQEILNENENSKRKTKKPKEQIILNDETTNLTKRKKTKISTTDNEEKKSKEKKRKPKKTKNDDENEEPVSRHRSTQSSAKFIPINTTNNINECYNCRGLENTDRMKLIEHSSQVAALTNEEIKLKSLHRRLEMRIKRFLHRTRNSIFMQEKLLNIEKNSQKELLIRKNLMKHGKSSQQNNIKQIEDDNIKLEKSISSLCNKIKQIENNSERNKKTNDNQYEIEQDKILMQRENQLHRMNLELSKIYANNTDLRIDIKRMLDKRREMIDEYNRLSIVIQNATDESRQLTSECSESFANRRNLVARMRSVRDQHDRDEKKLLNDIRELDRLLESNYASKNFFLKKSNVRQEHIRLNELFAGKRSKGAQSAYTADEFHRLFRIGFDQNFVKEKVLNRTVETFLNEQEQSFTLFEYAVELINELDHLYENLDNKRKYISNIFSTDNIDSFVIKDIFSTLENSVNEANMNVESLELAKRNLRELLNTAYELIYNLFFELNCDRNIILSSEKSINDRNILFYLAAIENRVQQLLPTKKIYRKGGGHHSYIDDTTISWRIDHQNHDQSPLLTSTTGNKQHISDNLQEIDFITPQILPIEQNYMNNDDMSKNISTDIVNSVLNVYNECIHTPMINMNNNVTVIGQIDEVK
ncbi:unnamed protein product [Adineta steineri]|uniref:ODAD1 central coiled coil region domain-containing protein n=1 Tax=Adineta steineri TaxID=433720 RepID=A0A814EVQ5_9BILA|nr:unnamed protein product [Adineta steineri]CAF1259194.1 unnamed protein product [Adineta steineri]